MRSMRRRYLDRREREEKERHTTQFSPACDFEKAQPPSSRAISITHLDVHRTAPRDGVEHLPCARGTTQASEDYSFVSYR